MSLSPCASVCIYIITINISSNIRCNSTTIELLCNSLAVLLINSVQINGYPVQCSKYASAEIEQSQHSFHIQVHLRARSQFTQ